MTKFHYVFAVKAGLKYNGLKKSIRFKKARAQLSSSKHVHYIVSSFIYTSLPIKKKIV